MSAALKLYQAEASKPSKPSKPSKAPRTTKCGRRYCLKAERKPAQQSCPGMLADLGINPEHLTGLREDREPRRSVRNRIDVVRMVERSRGVPFLSWVIAGLREELGCGSLAAWDALRCDEVKGELLARVLRQVAATGLGELTVREVRALVRAGWYVVPTSKAHLASLPTDNGMVTDELARKLAK